jgi:tRNA(Ile2) C34 agmatinyltransferase TiaS
MMILIGLDDTDTTESRGTGHLARQIAADLEADYRVLGVTRHQLLSDPRVPYTSHNSCAAIAIECPNGSGKAVTSLTNRIRALMLASFVPGSDPGLCIASHVPSPIIAFGRRVQRQLVSQAEARSLAADWDLPLLGLGGTVDGVIGALAGVGLAASGDDGRYVLVGHSRELAGLVAVADILAAGVSCVQTSHGQPVTDGLVHADKLRPARRGGRPVAVVEWDREYWRPLKLD